MGKRERGWWICRIFFKPSAPCTGFIILFMYTHVSFGSDCSESLQRRSHVKARPWWVKSERTSHLGPWWITTYPSARTFQIYGVHVLTEIDAHSPDDDFICVCVGISHTLRHCSPTTLGVRWKCVQPAPKRAARARLQLWVILKRALFFYI